MGLQSALDSTVVHGWNYYWKSTHLPELSDDLIDVIVSHAFSCSSPRSYVAMFHLKGAVSQVAEGVKAASVIMEFADKCGISMPIAREVDGVINHGSTVEQAYRGLVAEKPGHEVHGSGF